MSSPARAARRRRERYAKRGRLGRARLYELNAQRRLPRDHPSADDHETGRSGAHIWGDIAEEGVRRRGPILTTDADAVRMYQYVGATGVCKRIDEVLRAHPGEQPVLSTQMVLTAMLLAAQHHGSYKRTVLCEVVSGLDAAVAVKWGLLDPDSCHSLLSYNMVWRQALRIERFLRDGAETADGTRIDLQWMVDRFLPPSVPKWAVRHVAEIALDGTDYQTWARTTDFTRQSEIDAGRIPPETIFKLNGKIRRTEDDEDGTGHRSATSKHPAGAFNGYFAHLAVAVRAFLRGKRQQPVPPYIVAMVLAPADQHVGPIGYQVATKAKQLAPSVKVVKVDQHYTAKKTTFVRPLREHGWEIVMNQAKDRQGGVKLITAGRHNTTLLVHCGTPLVEWTPEHLRAPSDGLTGTARQQWFDERAKYQWVVIEHFPDGRKKMMCPQCAGKVRSTAKTYNRNRAKRRSPLPVTAVADREYCCDGMITLGVDQLDNYQRNAYGTTKWATDYAGRNPVEGVNGMIKDDGSLEKDSCRAFGLAAHTLAALAAEVDPLWWTLEDLGPWSREGVFMPKTRARPRGSVWVRES